MASKKKKPSWPPTGWKIDLRVTRHGRNYKCYINSKTGVKLFSKVAVLRYVKDGNRGSQGSHTTKGHIKTSAGKKQTHHHEANNSFALPPGWTIELKTRMSGDKKGTKYKCFIDPSTGSKFYSEPEVNRYIKSTKGNTGSSGQKVIVVRESDEDLPSGWIKEMRIKMRGDETIRRDPFYVDPGTGLVFRSKLEVLRYLETGEVSRHAYRRKNGSIDGKELTPVKSSSTSSSDGGKTRSRGGKLVFNDEVSPQESILAQPEAGINREVGSKRSKRSSSRVSSASVCEANFEQKTFLPEPACMDQVIVPVKPSVEKVSAIEETADVNKVGKSKAQDADEREIDNTCDEMVPPSTLSKCTSESVELQRCSNGKAQISKKKTKDKKVPTLPFRSSKRLAGVEAEVVLHSIPIEHTRLAAKRKSSKIIAFSRPDMIPSELKEKIVSLDDPQDVLASLEEKARVCQVESMKKSDKLTLESSNGVFFEEEYAPPGFSQNRRVDAPPIRMDQSVESPAAESNLEKFCVELEIPEVQPDTQPGSNIKPPEDYPVLEERAATVDKDAEQSGSQLCFSSPLWSDPCLEFAFKTLTGAIPLDDNVAIQDYIQHQLRTSSEQSNNNKSPAIGIPSFCQNDETKLVSPLPEDISFTNSNGFVSNKSNR